MGYSILWLFVTIPYVIMFLYFGFIFDFLDKYHHKKEIKALPFHIRYFYLIHYNKSMKYNLFDLDHRSKKIKTGNVSIKSYYFQLINYIYLIISFIIMFLRSVFFNINIFIIIYRISLIISIVTFLILIIFFIFIKKKIINKSLEC